MSGPMSSALLLSALVAATTTAAHRARAQAQAGELRTRVRGERAASTAPAWFGALLGWAELRIVPERAWPVARWSVGVVGLVVVVVAPILAVVGVVLGSVAVTLQPVARRRRESGAFEGDLPGAIDGLVAMLTSGSSLGQALGGGSAQSGPVGADLALVAARQGRGLSLQESLDQWARDRPGTGVAFVVDALALAGTSGGSQSRALEGVGATLRERQALAREVRALGSQARTSAVVLVVTPVAFAAVVAAADPRIRHLLLATPLGWMCIVTGAVLDAVGAWWMARLVGGTR